jgi:hypothetical protein
VLCCASAAVGGHASAYRSLAVVPSPLSEAFASHRLVPTRVPEPGRHSQQCITDQASLSRAVRNNVYIFVFVYYNTSHVLRSLPTAWLPPVGAPPRQSEFFSIHSRIASPVFGLMPRARCAALDPASQSK